MTPWECAESLADFFKEKLKEYDEKLYVHDEAGQREESKEYNIYAGYLPYVTSRDDKKKLCPAIAVRPLEVNDTGSRSTVLIGIYVTTYDDKDMKTGCKELYHMLEFLRMQLLSNNPVRNKWEIVPDTMSASIPDEQPFPQWWGRIDMAVYIPQPRLTHKAVVAR